MSKNEKTKFTVYLDEDMLRKTDKAVLASGLKSRNEFIIKAIENYIAELTLTQANPVLADKLAEVISQSNDVAMKKSFKWSLSLRRISRYDGADGSGSFGA